MTWLDLSYGEALRYLRTQRGVAWPNAGFKKQLLQFEKSDLREALRKEMLNTEGSRKLLKSDLEVLYSFRCAFLNKRLI